MGRRVSVPGKCLLKAEPGIAQGALNVRVSIVITAVSIAIV